MNFKKTIFCILLLNLLAYGLFAQDKPVADECPVLSITAPPTAVESGENLTFTAEVKGGFSNIIYNWTVDKGEIISGQGTPTIKVATNGLDDEKVTATVSISGDFSADICQKTASESGVVTTQPKPRLVERLENPNSEYHMMILDGFFIELLNNPSETGYVITFGTSRSVARKELQIRSYIRARKFDPSRIVLVNGGIDPKTIIEHWIVPAGADPASIPINPPEEKTADSSKDDKADVEEETVDKTKPYIFSSEYYDGVVEYGERDEMDLEGYAQFLKENPKARGNIVIIFFTKAEFREKEKEILDFLTSKGIARKRLRTFHKKTFGGVELWILP